MTRPLLPALVIVFHFITGAPARADSPAEEFQRDIRPLLAAHCVGCHGTEKQKGGVSFAPIQDDRSILRARKIWQKSIAQLESQEMPPKDARNPLPAEARQRLLAWLRKAAQRTTGDDATRRDPGPSPARRLSLAEYNNTIRDLLGVEFNAANEVGLPDESGEGNPFGNLANALDIPPALMDKYFAAAEKVLDRFFGTELRSNVNGRIIERARRGRERLFGVRPFSWRDPKTVIQPPGNVPPRDAARAIMADLLPRAYRRPVRDAEIDSMLALFDRASDRGESYVNSVRWMLKASLVSPHFLFRLERDQAPAGSTAPYRITDHELAVRLSYLIWSSMPDDWLRELADQKLLTAERPPTTPVKLRGTVIGVPVRREDWLLEDVFDGNLETYYEGPGPDNNWVGLDLLEPRTITQIRYAPRKDQPKRMIGGKFQASNAPDFAEAVDLFTIEKEPAQGRTARDVTAEGKFRYVRYLAPARSNGNIAEMEVWGILDGPVLEQQVRRMLADPKARALTDQFGTRFLQINRLPTARPSTEFFPDFYPEIRQLLYEETAMFFDGLRTGDRSVLDLLDADYTYLNEQLAKYYRIPGVEGKEMRRVALKPEYHRGGLLSMGSVLALTSHTSRTSPTMRGKYILEVMLGAPPPPPPPDAGQIQEDKQKKDPRTFREKLAQHAVQDSCAGCHRKLDPLGFALENFNGAGLWREKDREQPIDASAVLPSGQKINGLADLKKVLHERQEDFLRNLAEQLLLFGLGRELDYYDDRPVLEITQSLKKDNGRFSTLVLGVVRSYPFQHRRNLDAKED